MSNLQCKLHEKVEAGNQFCGSWSGTQVVNENISLYFILRWKSKGPWLVSRLKQYGKYISEYNIGLLLKMYRWC